MYDLKYQSTFYNIYKTKVDVQIYKRNYGAHSVINLRTSGVVIETNYQDRYTPIVGTGAKVDIINEGAFDSLDDLLTSREKEFYCTIAYNNLPVFFGFSLCDMNEQEFISHAKITLQFTDYLRRLDGDYLLCLKDIGINTAIYEMLQEAFERIISSLGTGSIPLVVNSTLLETNMLDDPAFSFLEQTFVENNMFFTSADQYDNTYDAINKALKSFGAFLYSFGNMWVIERQEDISTTHDWVQYDLVNSNAAGEPITTLKQEYNKQDGDWKYKDISQVVGYDSGLKTLILDLKDKQLGSLVFNNYKVPMLTVADNTPDAGTLDTRTWYITDQATTIGSGYSFRGMNTYFKWMYPVEVSDPTGYGMYYNFEMFFNISEENPTVLSVSYKVSAEVNLALYLAADTGFYLRFDGGTLSNNYLGNITGPTGATFLGYDPSPIFNEQLFDVSTDKKTKMWTVSAEFNLSDAIVIENIGGGGVPLPPDIHPSIWEVLGKPKSQKFTIMFMPLVFLDNVPPPHPARLMYIGDVEVTITQQEILNKLTYYVNEDFIKTETVDIEFFDLPNMNFSNGLLRENGTIKTENWTSENCPTAVSLMDIFAKNIFRNSYRTIHRLKATVLCDKYLKPFSILTDDNLKIDSASVRTLILQGYTWDLNNGEYEIDAEEYTDEEINLDQEGDESSGNPGEITDPSQIPVPTGLSVSSAHNFDVWWDASAGATGYILQRRPITSPSRQYWFSSWRTVYSGPLRVFFDDISLEYAPLTDGMLFEYQVCAYIPNGNTPYSAIVSIIYHPAP
jgi:hypothetical protein